MHPLARGIDLETVEATRVHRRLIREKSFLNRLYRHYYAEFLAAHGQAPPGARVEIGSGSGFLVELIPGLVSLDLRPGADVSVVGSAMALPFSRRTAGAVFILNTLHHLPDPVMFLEEVSRILKPLGRCVVIEPFVSPFSRFLNRNFHHEPFDPEADSWKNDPAGLQSGANLALPWILFYRDRHKFEAQFPELRILRRTPHTIWLHLLSGGVSRKALLPGMFFGPALRIERLMRPLNAALAIMMTVELIRKPSAPR